MHAPESRFVQLRAGRFHYLDYGAPDAPPLVMIHGTGFVSWLWDPYARALAARYRVYALDARGHGDSTQEAPDYAWSSLAADLLDFIDALELKKPYCVGHSMGAVLILLAEAARPGSIGRAALVDPVIVDRGFYRGAWTLETDTMAKKTLERRAEWDSRAQMLESYERKPPFSRWRADILDLFVRHATHEIEDGRVRLKCPPEIEARVYLGGHSPDPWPGLARVACPAVLLRGTGGDTAKIAKSREVAAAMPNARLIEIPDRTHFLPMEDPDWTLARIEEFGAGA